MHPGDPQASCPWERVVCGAAQRYRGGLCPVEAALSRKSEWNRMMNASVPMHGGFLFWKETP
ncbi:MAG: hypothetical protein IJY42_05965 [Clostridia bacterium]|nr:hypothetical protein [Clostridia bacterium]